MLRRVRLSKTLLPLLALALALPGCGGDSPSPSGDDAADTTGRPATPAADSAQPGDTVVEQEPQAIDPATTGSLGGRVSLAGPAPERSFVRMVGEAWCMGAHENGGFLDESLLVADGGVANAFVWIESGLDGWIMPEPEGPVVLDQQGCLYTPRVFGIRPKQELQARNSDPITHNVHTKGRKEENKSTPAGDMRSFDFKREEIMVEIVCDIHAWMKGWAGVVDHPFFAVTAADGSWSLEGVPPGRYTVGVWHEVLGQRSAEVLLDESGAVSDLDTVF